jgi:hypothetical protein
MLPKFPSSTLQVDPALQCIFNCLSDVCEHRRIGDLVNSALAVPKHPVPVDHSSLFLLHEDVLSVVGIFFVRDCFFLDDRVHLVVLLFV